MTDKQTLGQFEAHMRKAVSDFTAWYKAQAEENPEQHWPLEDTPIEFFEQFVAYMGEYVDED